MRLSFIFSIVIKVKFSINIRNCFELSFMSEGFVRKYYIPLPDVIYVYDYIQRCLTMKNPLRNLVIVISILSLLVFTSCRKDGGITASKTELSWTSDGGKKVIDITADCEWTVSYPDWITCEPTSGSGSMQLTVRAARNNALERKGVLGIVGGNASAQVDLSQDGFDFTVSQVLFEFDSESTPIRFTVVSGYDWTIRIPQEASWVKASPDSGSAGETQVTLTPDPVTERIPRDRAFITLDYGKSFTMLTVSQVMPNKAPDRPSLVSPADGASDVRVNVIFDWTDVNDPDGDKVSYRLMLSKDGGQIWDDVYTSESGTAYPDKLSRNTEYIWKVEAVDAFGARTESEARTFTTGDGGIYEDGEVSVWQIESAEAPDPVHLIFLGDGFIEEDYEEGGAFDKAVGAAVDAFFSIEPYSSYKDYFRISTVAVYSPDRGATIEADMPSVSAQERNTAFSSVLEGGKSTAVSCNYEKVLSYALTVPGMSEAGLDDAAVLLLINVDAYAGTCVMYASGRSVAMCPMGKDSFRQVVSHEGGGHGFGRLLDEYRPNEGQIPEQMKEDLVYWRKYDPYYGYNIDVTGDRANVHWAHYFSRKGYEAVEMFEGGYLYQKGVWRPEEVSCMQDNRSYYNAPSREAIVRRIMKVSGKSFIMNDCIDKDSVTKAPDVKSDYVGVASVPFAPPVKIDNL